MYATTQKELAPEEDQGILFNIVKSPQTANLDYLEQATGQLNKVFETVPEKEHVFIINGMGNDVHQAFAGILFKPWEERKRTQKQILQSLQPKVAGIAGAQAISFALPSLPGSTGGPPVQFVITTTADYPAARAGAGRAAGGGAEERPVHLHRRATSSSRRRRSSSRSTTTRPTASASTCRTSAARWRRCSAATTSTASIFTAAAIR